MHTFAALLAPIALLLPTAAVNERAALTPEGDTAEAPVSYDPALQPPFEAMFDAYRSPSQGQVRVTQRVTIRITAHRQDARETLSAEFPTAPGPLRTHLEERKMGDCVAVGDIAAVDPGPENRLILYMRDRTMVSAALDRECSAREFYSGFYVERTDDGKLCIKRDKLQSRAGASCGVKRLSRLVSVRD
jgi:hypothetical protein